MIISKVYFKSLKNKFQKKKSKPSTLNEKLKHSQLKTNKYSIFFGIIGSVGVIVSLIFSIYTFKKQSEFQSQALTKDSIQQYQQKQQFETTIGLMNSYISINDSLRDLVSQLLEQNRQDYLTELEKNKSKFLIVLDSAVIKNDLILKNNFYPRFYFTITNTGVFNAYNTVLQIYFLGPMDNYVFSDVLSFPNEFDNKTAQKAEILVKMANINSNIFYIKAVISWFDILLERSATREFYFTCNLINGKIQTDINLDDILKERINSLLKKNKDKIEISTLEYEMVFNKYPDWKRYTERNNLLKNKNR